LRIHDWLGKKAENTAQECAGALGWGVKPRVGEGYQIQCQTSVSALRVAPAEAGVNARMAKFDEKNR
jgi:hypothetical protein